MNFQQLGPLLLGKFQLISSNINVKICIGNWHFLKKKKKNKKFGMHDELLQTLVNYKLQIYMTDNNM